MVTVYGAAGGKAGLERLAAAWHDRVMADDVVSHAFSHGFDPHHVERLAAYWGEALGGPALTDVGLVEGDPVRCVLHDYFAWATFNTMNRYEDSPDDVPEGLRIPLWSWDELVEDLTP